MPASKYNIKVGAKFKSTKCGRFKIIAELNKVDGRKRKTYKVRFIKTGYETTTNSHSITTGAVKDPYATTILGVGYIGEGSHSPTKNGKINPLYRRWSNMLSRCYGRKYCSGATVHPSWLCFQTFADDISEMPNYKRRGFALDKDILSSNKGKQYGPDNCCFISKELNTVMRDIADLDAWKKKKLATLNKIMKRTATSFQFM